MPGYREALQAARNNRSPHRSAVGAYMDAIHECHTELQEHPDNPEVAMDFAEALTLGFDKFRDVGYGGFIVLYVIGLLPKTPAVAIDLWGQHLEDSRTGFLSYLSRPRPAQQA